MWTVNRTLKALCLMVVWGSMISIGACGGRTLGGHLVEEECTDGVDNDGDGDTDCDDEDCAQDPACESLCGDGVVNGAEACDGADLDGQSCLTLGFEGGTLGCAAECVFDTSGCAGGGYCGNRILDSGEQCDGTLLGEATCASLGYDGGELSCGTDCLFDVSRCCGQEVCGNDIAGEGEECDGSDLQMKDCKSFGFDGGTLLCSSDCFFDTSQCTLNPLCGNGVLDGGEECDSDTLGGLTCLDFGYPAGELGCYGDCTYDFSDCRMGECGNSIIEDLEECDGMNLGGMTCEALGFEGGMLQCNDMCGFDISGCISSYCGNNTTEPGEECDGTDLSGYTCESLTGYPGGTLSCGPDCLFDTSGCLSCGNGVREGDEQCDGSDLGGSTCQDLGFSGGILICDNTCNFNTGGCSGFSHYFFEDFEDPFSGWTLTGDWQVGTPSATDEPPAPYEGQACTGTVMGGQYSNDNTYESCALISPEIDLSLAQSPVLVFHHFIHAEANWDGGKIYVSSDDGQTWTALTDNELDPDHESQANNLPAYAQSGTSPYWKQVIGELSAYTGQVIRVRFSFFSDNIINSYPGWYVDNVMIAEWWTIPVSHESPEHLGYPGAVSSFSTTLSAKGGSGTYSWNILGGTNHGWLNLHPINGTLSGTPSASNIGYGEITVRVADTNHPTNYADKTFQFEVIESVVAPYTQDFNTGYTGWILTGDWQWGMPSGEGPGQCYDGSTGCLGTILAGNYNHQNGFETCIVRSPPIDLSSLTSPQLTFYHYVDSENNFDGGNLWISTDGVQWDLLEGTLLNPTYFDDEIGPSGDKYPAYAGDYTPFGWHMVTGNLSAYAGQTIYLRFSFFSDQVINKPGWYIDQITIDEP